MKLVPISEIPKEKHTIELQNGKTAVLAEVILTRVPEINLNEDIMVYRYMTPCSLCGGNNIAYSYDGKVFANIQLNCRYCGVYYRPIIKR